MAEINTGKDVKTIAFYLPQYHEIPENDEWWGKGFTEWTNTKRAKPLFEGHYQPKTPLHENYYDLVLDENVMIEQAMLAKKYGVWGFCYYHYWFKDGRKLLEKPVERMLSDDRIDIPYCLCWANENWSRNWDGGNNEVIMEQDYGGEEDWEKHFCYLLDFIRDERYISFDGKPILVIYKPQLMKRLNEMLDYWQKRAKECGLKGLVFAYQYPTWYFMKDYDPSRFDYRIGFEPVLSNTFMQRQTRVKILLHKIRQFYYKNYKKLFKETVIREKQKDMSKERTLKKFDYDAVWEKSLNIYHDKKLLNGAFTDWDNTARNVKGALHLGAAPDKFERYMTRLICEVFQKDKDRVIFVNAWNEWAEGCYLEPDEKNGYGYLEALKKALETNHALPGSVSD